jgi:cobalt-precorrin 5A hydrolase
VPYAIIAITANGAKLGEKLNRGIPESELFAIEKHATAGAEPFSESLRGFLTRLWPRFDGFIFIMATGIVVRSIAPLLQGKDKDPAVVVMDDAGRFAVSLLSGHLGGANALAKLCAEVVNGTPVITTATDVNELPSFDMLAKDLGWLIEDLSRVKILNALMLEGKEIAVVDHHDEVRNYCAGKGRLSCHDSFDKAVGSGASGFLFVTNRLIPEQLIPQATLVLRPRNLCLGIGCNRGTSAEEIESVVMAQLKRLALSFKSVKCVASAEAKSDEAGLLAFAATWELPTIFYGSGALNGVDIPSPPSPHAFAAIGARGVAEPAALLASAGGKLICNKIKDRNVTLAIAEMAGSDHKL